ncbi:MAG: hypothetical protein AB2A00_06060 [Myxococcota bacterium]
MVTNTKRRTGNATRKGRQPRGRQQPAQTMQEVLPDMARLHALSEQLELADELAKSAAAVAMLLRGR